MTWKTNRILSAIEGTNPMLIKELEGGYVVFGDVQFLPGYCVLLPKRAVHSLNDLSIEERMLFLRDMSIVGDAIINTCSPIRINYDILGNTDNFLHAHIFPRYEWESDERKKMPVWLYDNSNWSNPETNYTPEKHDTLRLAILNYLNERYEVNKKKKEVDIKLPIKVKFGGTAEEQDELAGLVLNNAKTATSSLLELKKESNYTKKDDLWEVLDSKDNLITTVKVTNVVVKKFVEINEDFALKEGDGSLANWTEIHKNYYSYLLANIGKSLVEDTLLECVYFDKI